MADLERSEASLAAHREKRSPLKIVEPDLPKGIQPPGRMYADSGAKRNIQRTLQ